MNGYPAHVEVQTPEVVERWRPLVQWILDVPHVVIAGALGYVSGAIAMISWFIIVITGRLPSGLADFQVMILRYSTRSQLYSGFLHDSYPPFDFTMSSAEPGGTPVRLGVEPKLEDRDRLTVGLRFVWAIPAAFFAFAVAVVGSVCWFLAFFAVVVTGRWPQGLWGWVMKMTRVSVRFSAYVLLLTDEYPPFATD